jgi:hypothetical protein
MVFCFVQKYFFRTTKREFFFQNLTLGYMTKTLNQIIFFFLHQNQNIFFSNIRNQNIFFRKANQKTPLQVKWSFPNAIESADILNRDLNTITSWSNTWLVSFNSQKPKRWLSRGKSTNHIIHF